MNRGRNNSFPRDKTFIVANAENFMRAIDFGEWHASTTSHTF